VVAYYNEIDPYCVAWLWNLMVAGHIPLGDIDDRPIQTVSPADLHGYTQCHFFAGIAGWPLALHLAGWPEGRPVWTGSAPCQPFSVAGNRRGVCDDRHLWPDFYRLIRECKPDTVFGEQVGAAIGGGWLDLVFDDLEGEGYTCGATVLPACSVGAPHIRQRLYWVADSQHAKRRTNDGCGQDGCHGAHAGREETHGEPGARCEVCRLADAAGTGRRGRESGTAGRCAEPGGPGATGRLDNAKQQRLEGHTGYGDDGDQPGRDGAGTTRPVAPAGGAGPWSDIEWLSCRDGKSRPTRPRIRLLSDGVAHTMDSIGTCQRETGVMYGAQTEGNSREILQAMRCAYDAEGVRAEVGGSFGIQPAAVLRQEMHGVVADGEDQGRVAEGIPETGSKARREELPGLRDCAQFERTSRGRQPNEQCPGQPDARVFCVSHERAWALATGDGKTEAALSFLQRYLSQGGDVPTTLSEIQKAWESISDEEKAGCGICSGGRFCISSVSPIAPVRPGRTGQLRAYGNAIVPPLAAEFIRAFMACRP